MTRKGRREPTVWVCAACGRHAKLRDEVGDESCYLNAVLCWKSSLRYDVHGSRVVYARAATERGART